MFRRAVRHLGKGDRLGFGPEEMHQPHPLAQPSTYRAAAAIQRWSAGTWIVVCATPCVALYFWYGWWKDTRQPAYKARVEEEIERRGGLDAETMRYQQAMASKLDYCIRMNQLAQLEAENAKAMKQAKK